jgi:hypothetical protein
MKDVEGLRESTWAEVIVSVRSRGRAETETERLRDRAMRQGEWGEGKSAQDALGYDPGPHSPHVASLKAPEITDEHTIRAWRGQHAARGAWCQRLPTWVQAGSTTHTKRERGRERVRDREGNIKWEEGGEGGGGGGREGTTERKREKEQDRERKRERERERERSNC